MRIDQLDAGEVASRLGDVVLLVGTDGSILDANPAALACYGYTHDEFVCLSVRDIRAPGGQDAIDGQMKRAAENGTLFRTVHVRKDGTTFPAEVSSAAIAVDGELALLSLVRDTTESDRVLEVLNAEAALHAQAESVAHIGSWRMDAVTRDIEWSDEMYALLGLDRASHPGDLRTSVRACVHPEDLPRFEEAVEAASRGEIRKVEACRIVRPDGSVRWVRGGVSEVRDASGNVTALQGFVQDVTESQDAAQALRTRDRMTHALLDAITESAFLMTVEGELVALNATMADRYGADTSADLLGRNVFDYIAPDVADGRRGFVAQVVATGEPATFEDVRAGRHMLNSLYPVMVDGTVTHVAGFGYDMTDMQEASESLRTSERWLSESQRVARLGHYVFEIGADRWDSSAALDELFGIDGDYDRDFGGWLGIVHPDERERMSRYFAEEVIGKRQPFDLEYRILRPADGAERWVHGLGQVDFAEDGSPIQMFGVIQDITDRKRAERELRLEQELLMQVEAVAHVGSWRVSLNGDRHTWSAEAARIMGVDPAETPDDPLAAFAVAVHPDDRWAFDVTELGALWRDGDRSLDFRIVRPDGEIRWVSARGKLEAGADGQPTAVHGVVQDVTDRKRAEDERMGVLEEAANVDRLTGLHNRRGFDLVADQAIAQAMRAEQGIGLIYCDVDELKAINDEFGHAQGDRALQDAASILKFTLRSADAMARIGGDEFIVLAIGGEEDAIVRLNERLQEGLDFFNATNDRPFRLGMSSGIAWCSAGEPCRFESLKATADKGMYAEKLRRSRS